MDLKKRNMKKDQVALEAGRGGNLINGISLEGRMWAKKLQDAIIHINKTGTVSGRSVSWEYSPSG